MNQLCGTAATIPPNYVSNSRKQALRQIPHYPEFAWQSNCRRTNRLPGIGDPLPTVGAEVTFTHQPLPFRTLSTDRLPRIFVLSATEKQNNIPTGKFQSTNLKLISAILLQITLLSRVQLMLLHAIWKQIQLRSIKNLACNLFPIESNIVI